MTERNQQVFEDGWKHGAEFGPASVREVEESRPDLTAGEVERFCNGSDDGAAGDVWRLNRGRELLS